MEKSLKSLRKLCLGISWGLCCNGDLIIFHLVGPIKYSPHKKGWSFCWVSDTVLSVVPKVGNTEAQIPYKSGIVGIFCALWLLPVCQCTDCHGTDFVYHRCTTSFWVMMSEGTSMQPQCNSINFNRSGWKIIAVSRSREDTEWVSYEEIRIMAPSMLLIFELYVPILDKQVKKMLQKYIPHLAWSRRHGESRSPGQQYNSPTALSVWQSQLLGMTSHSDSIGHQNFSGGILWMSRVRWQWTIALSELLQAFVNLQCGGAELWLGLFDLIVERGWLQRGNLSAKAKLKPTLLLSLKIMFKF